MRARSYDREDWARESHSSSEACFSDAEVAWIRQREDFRISCVTKLSKSSIQAMEVPAQKPRVGRRPDQQT